MNKEIQSQLKNIMNLGKEANEGAEIDQDLLGDVNEEISNFFDPNVPKKVEPKPPLIEKKVDEMEQRMAKKAQVQKDVQKFLDSLPENVTKPVVSSMKVAEIAQKPPKPENPETTEEEEKITSRKLTKKYLTRK